MNQIKFWPKSLLLIPFITFTLFSTKAELPINETKEEFELSNSYEKQLIASTFSNTLSENSLEYLETLLYNGRTFPEENFKKIQKQIETSIREINSGFDKLSNQKKFKKFKKVMFADYFINFDRKAKFEDLFEKKRYNTRTACALYAFFMDHFEMPFSIGEKEAGSYIYFYPADNKFYHQPGPVDIDFLIPNDDFKIRYADFLVECGALDQKERQRINVEDLYNEYYFIKEIENLDQVVSLIYYDRGMIELEKPNNIEFANRYFNQSFNFDQNNRNAYWFDNAITARLNNPRSFETETDFLIISKIANINKGDAIANSKAISLFQYMAAYYLDRNKNFPLLDSLSTVIIKNTEHKASKQEMKKIQYSFTAYNAFNNKDYASAIKFTQKGLEIDSQDKALLEYLSMAVMDSMFTSVKDDLNPIIDQFDHYAKLYPALETFETFQSGYVHCYLGMATQYFIDRKPEKGHQSLDLFKAKLKDFPEIWPKEQLLVDAYVMASLYYVDTNDNATAAKLIEEADQLLPGNAKLENLLKNLRNK